MFRGQTKGYLVEPPATIEEICVLRPYHATKYPSQPWPKYVPEIRQLLLEMRAFNSITYWGKQITLRTRVPVEVLLHSREATMAYLFKQAPDEYWRIVNELIYMHMQGMDTGVVINHGKTPAKIPLQVAVPNAVWRSIAQLYAYLKEYEPNEYKRVVAELKRLDEQYEEDKRNEPVKAFTFINGVRLDVIPLVPRRLLNDDNWNELERYLRENGHEEEVKRLSREYALISEKAHYERLQRVLEDFPHFEESLKAKHASLKEIAYSYGVPFEDLLKSVSELGWKFDEEGNYQGRYETTDSPSTNA